MKEHTDYIKSIIHTITSMDSVSKEIIVNTGQIKPKNNSDSFQLKETLRSDVILGEAKITKYYFRYEKTKEGKYNFKHKDYYLDISPEKFYLSFKKMTFVFNIKTFSVISWKEIRTALEELNLIEKDISGIQKSLVSIDKLRMKMQDDSMTDKEIYELRRNMYGLAEVIYTLINTNHE